MDNRSFELVADDLVLNREDNKMKNLYKNEACMSFTNSEIIEYLIKPLREYPNINLRFLSTEGEEISELMEEKISSVCFDGRKENFHISFNAHQTSIFISDEGLPPERKYTFNEEFMFIDENNKQYYTSSDTYKNVVYEGCLRCMTHKQILELFLAIIILLNGAHKILIEETIMRQEGVEYPKCKYVVRIYNNLEIQKSVKYENILFLVN